MDNAGPLSLLPQSSPNEPVVLYDGEVVLGQGASETRGIGSATLRWFPSPGIRLDVTVQSGPVPKLGDKARVELGTMVGDVLVSSHSFGGMNPTWPDRVGGFISSMNDRDTGGFAWLRFQIVNSLDFLTPATCAAWRTSSRPLIEDNSVKSEATSIVNGEIGYKLSDRISLKLEGFNTV